MNPEEKKFRAEQRKQDKYNKEHKVINGVNYKLCNKHSIYFPDKDCWVIATSEYFYINTSNGMDGLSPECIECSKAKANKWVKENPEEKKKRNYTYYHENEQKERDRSRKFWGSRPDLRLRKLQRFYAKNPEKAKEYLEKRFHKIHEISEREWKYCKNYFGNACAYCGRTLEEHYLKYNTDLHKEHKDFNGSTLLNNCVPSCEKCNYSKWIHELDNWYNENNPNFSKERLDKIIKWCSEDYLLYFEPKTPYRLLKKQNDDKKTFHFELWSVNGNRDMIKCYGIKNKKKDFKDDINTYYNELKSFYLNNGGKLEWIIQ